MKFGVVLTLSLLALCNATLKEEEADAAEYLKNKDKEILVQQRLAVLATWDYETNITAATEKADNDAAVVLSTFMQTVTSHLKTYNWTFFESADTKRQIKSLTNPQTAILSTDDYGKFKAIVNNMSTIYSTATVCDYNNRTKCDLPLDPDLRNIFSDNRVPQELAYYWTQWYDHFAPVRGEYKQYVDLSNKAAKMNNFSTAAESWLDEYEDNTFEDQLDQILVRLRPIYEQIHGYVRDKLNKYYGDDVVSKTGPIPMHLLGNPWAEEWFTIPDIIIPFPNKSVIDVSDEMKSQGYTPKKMFELADDFYSSMGLMRVPQTFWDKSVLQNPNDGRDLVCSASAWDFFLGDDVRIKQCTEVTQNDLSVLHHEMGHIQSYLQHRTQPWVYRFSPNSGFDEAIGDVMALSILTPKHLQSIGLLKNYVQDEETRINKLFLTAVEKLVFLPYAFTLDKYRWSLFRGEIEEKNWNCEFWKLRDQYCGVEPPVVRTEKSFDAPAKYHVSADIDYIRYFVAYIMEFQFYKTLCTIAGQYDPANPELPMDNCDLYGSKEAGEAFKKLLVHGSSKPWPDVLEEFNGERKMSGDAIAEYFEPLRVWLEAENKKNNISIGWTPSNKCTPA